MSTKAIREVKLKNLTITLVEDSIIRIEVDEHCVVDIDEVKEVQKVKRSLIGDQKHSVLFITPKFGTMTKEAREYSATKEVNVNAMGKAIVLNGLAMRILANFFISFNKPPVEHRVFENEKDALRWLRTLK